VTAPRPFHHVGYVVEDIPRAVERAVVTFGAGPFFLVDHLAFDEVTFAGAPAAYDHSSAFGQWGPIMVELTQIHSAEPPGLAEAFGGPMPRVGHAAWLADDLETESERLTALGIPVFHTGRSGPVRAHWHDARSTLGHHIEVLQKSPQVLGFYDLIRSSANGWDGTDPIRPAPGPEGPG
jgi:Glyoxalase/Bleomycin resistance protein/Dioxygenase superfamily